MATNPTGVSGIDNADTQFDLKTSTIKIDPTLALGEIPLDFGGPDFLAAYQAVHPGATEATLTAALGTFVQSSILNSSSTVTTWASFLSQWETAAGETVASDPYSDQNYQGVYGDYASLLQLPTTVTDPTNLGDWSILVNNADPSSNSTYIDTSSAAAAQGSLNILFNGTFAKFLATLKSNPPSGTPAAVGQSFIDAWYETTGLPNFGISPTAVFSTSGLPATYSDLMNYFQMFQAFFPGATQAQYQTLLVQFVDQSIGQTGYFLPSQFIEQWFTFLQSPNPVASNSAAAQLSANQARILNEAFSLLIQMIDVIQHSAIAQANYLTFLSNYQNAYSNLLLLVPVASNQNIQNASFNPDNATDVNTKLQQIIQNLQAQRGIYTNYSKQFQSNVSSSQDAASQQANIASSILDEITSILATIFK